MGKTIIEAEMTLHFINNNKAVGPIQFENADDMDEWLHIIQQAKDNDFLNIGPIAFRRGQLEYVEYKYKK